MDDLVSWLAGQDWSIETRRSWRAALRRFYEWAVMTGRATRSPAAALPTLPTPSSVPRPAPDEAVAAGMHAADERVRLMVELGARLGLRRGEIARVRAEDLERDLVGWSLRVRGKGSRARLLPCPDDVAAAIRRRPSGSGVSGAAGVAGTAGGCDVSRAAAQVRDPRVSRVPGPAGSPGAARAREAGDDSAVCRARRGRYASGDPLGGIARRGRPAGWAGSV